MLNYTILIASDTEWSVVYSTLGRNATWMSVSPFGGIFRVQLRNLQLTFAHIGWGKISAAAGTQWVIDNVESDLLVLFGTCGGLADYVTVGQLLLAERVIVYDLSVRIGSPEPEFLHYSTDLPLDWFAVDAPDLQRATIMSADSDLDPQNSAQLHSVFGGVACDWESAAVGFVARISKKNLLIFKYVSDVISSDHGDVYDASDSLFLERVDQAVRVGLSRVIEILESLPTSAAPVSTPVRSERQRDVPTK